MITALIAVVGALAGVVLTGLYNGRTSRQSAKEARQAAAISWNRERAHAVMLIFLEKARKVDRWLYQAHLEGEEPADEGHDLSDPTDGWLDEVWDAAEAIQLYGSVETTAAALKVGDALQAFGAALPNVPVELATAPAAALDAYRKAVRLDLGIDQPVLPARSPALRRLRGHRRA